MNIYIYGDKIFTKDMQSVLSKQSIQEKLEEIALSEPEFGNIKVLESSLELQDVIIHEPESIFLIDDKEIIQNTWFTKIFKFLNPKDGITKAFLNQHEIAIGIEIDSVATITQYILDKLDTYKPHEIEHIDEIREPDIHEALSQI